MTSAPPPHRARRRVFQPVRRLLHVPPAALPGLAAAGFGLALMAESVLILSGQWLSPKLWLGWSAAALWALAIAAYVAVVVRAGDDSGPVAAAGPRPAAVGRDGSASIGSLRIACAVLGLVAGGAAVALIQVIGDDKPARTYVWILALWSVGVAVYTLGFALPADWLRPRGFTAFARRHRTVLIDGAALFAVALALRLFALDRVPNVLTGDEGVFGLAARWMSRGEGGHMFSTYWANGTLYLVPHAVLALVLEAGTWATRLPTAVGGALAAPATYALGKVVASRRVGVVAGLFVAVSHLHVHLSRIGLGHGLDAVSAAVAGAALVHAVRTRDTRSAAVAGLALGLAQYGYVGGRLVDVVALVFAVLSAAMIGLVARPRGRTRSWWSEAGVRPLLVAFGGALVVAGPMIRWALVRPNDYFSRLSAQGILQTGKWTEVAERVGNAPLAIAWSQARDAVFALVAAPAHEFYFSPYPMLDVVWAGLFGLGFAACVARPADRGRLWLVLQIVLAWFTLALGAHASTASYRISGALPAMAVLAALALFVLTDTLWSAEDEAARDPAAASADDAASAPGAPEPPAPVPLAPTPDAPASAPLAPAPPARRVHWATPAGLVAGIVCFQIWAYWGVFAPGCRFFDAGTAAASQLGATVQSYGGGRAVFVLGRPWFDAGVYESVRYLSDRTMEPFDGAAPEHTRADADPAMRLARIFDVPEGADLDALVGRIRDTAPAMIFAAPQRRSELDFLAKRLGDQRVHELARCPAPEGTLLGMTMIDRAAPASDP
ncbi:MAG: hypothetical protein IT332_07775 [Ardenticatenales bacterium]|nr:hypothetical protein [Ardenticatenales bacterium]